MKQRFSASLSREGRWAAVQCLEVDIASQGQSEAEALSSLEEALALHFTEPAATATPCLVTIEVEVGAA